MEKIIIEGEIFEYIKTRAYTPISVYKGNNTYLRIGQSDLIKKELEQHKNLLACGFPIAEIVNEGLFEDKYYYIEKSFGTDIFSKLFRSDYEKYGAISDKLFTKFLALVEKFAIAQLKTVEKKDLWHEFEKTRNIDVITQELPDLKEKIIQAVEKAKTRLAVFPYVLTHGDFNPYNIFEQGVIDIEGVAYGPAGYDLITSIFHIKFFPKHEDYEMVRRFDFSQNQINEYLLSIDKLYIENNVPKLSTCVDDFLLFRMIWSAVRMQSTPKIQQWRYNLLRVILDKYLYDGSIVELL